MRTEGEMLSRMLKPVGRNVSFQYPGSEGHKAGVLRDRAVVRSNPGATGVPYWDVVDLIGFPDEPEPEWIRIGYYRKPGERLVWGSQTTIAEPVSVWKRILVQAATEKRWFRDLLEGAVKELSK